MTDSVNRSLAGRTAVLHLLPLARSEVVRFQPHPDSLDEAILTGERPLGVGGDLLLLRGDDADLDLRDAVLLDVAGAVNALPSFCA